VIINAFHPDYVKTYMPGFLTQIKIDADRKANGEKFGSKSKATRETVYGKTVNTINNFPKTQKRVSTDVTQFHIYSKAGTANTKAKK
jgi:hypothetical protein